MNLKEALLTQAPSLALQRAAADEIARLTKALEDDRAKAPQVPLTEEELTDRAWAWLHSGANLKGAVNAFQVGFRDAERIHGIKNKGN